MHEQDDDLADDELADELDPEAGDGDDIDGEVGDDGDDDADDDIDGDDDADDDDDDDADDDDGEDEDLSLGAALGRLVGLLVDQPEDIHILEEVDVKGDTVFTVQVAPDDLGKLIGRQGRTARSLRNFLEVRGQLDGKSYSLEIREQP